MKRRRTYMRSIPILVLIVLLGACGQPEESQPTPAPSPGDTDGEIPSGPLGEVIRAATADLAGEIGVPPQDIDVVVAEAVTWNDGSLGCPEPGMMYTQALVDGFRVVLDHDGVEYHYHAGEQGEPFKCPDAVLQSRPGSSIPPVTRSDR